MMDNIENMREYLYAFRPKLLEDMKELIERRDMLLIEEPDFKDEINKQFYSTLASKLGEELAQNFPTHPEEVLSLMETFNLERWLKGEPLKTAMGERTWLF